MVTVSPTGDTILDRLGSMDPATIYEAAGRQGALDPALKPVWPGASVVGRALPVRCHPGDNLAVHRALAVAAAGEVLVVDAAGFVAGYFGEVTAVQALARGIRGLVIDGGLRDSAALRRRGFPAWSRGISVLGTVKVTPGTVGEPVVCGGVLVRRGDYVVADDDGVVVLPHERAESVLQAAKRRIEKEAAMMAQLEAGALTLDLLGLRDALRAHGLAT